MRFRTRLMALVAGMIALIIVLLFGGWWASGRLLDATDFAYQQGLKLTQIVDMAREAQIAFQRQVQEWKMYSFEVVTPNCVTSIGKALKRRKRRWIRCCKA